MTDQLNPPAPQAAEPPKAPIVMDQLRGSGSGAREASRAAAQITFVAFFTAWVTTLSWSKLTADFAEVAMPTLLIGLILVGAGWWARRARVSVWLVATVQALVGGWLVVATTTDSLAPTPGNLGDFRQAFINAIESSREYAAPVSSDVPPVWPLLLTGTVIIVILVDLYAAGIRRVPLAGLVLLVAYLVPTSVTGEAVSWVLFVVAGGLFLWLLHLDHSDRINSWGHAGDREGITVTTGAVSTAATMIGAAALAAAVIVPLAVPNFDVAWFKGNGPGSGEVTVENPMVDLRRDLSRGVNVVLLTMETDDPDPDYLRVSVLTKFANGRWTPGDRDIPEDQTATGDLPTLDGVSTTTGRTPYTYDLRATTEFASTWLPTMSQTTTIEAGVDWRYDLSTRDFIGADDDVTTRGDEWSFGADELDYDPIAMSRAVSGASAVRPIFTEVPASVSSEVRSLAAAVTADGPTRYEKAQLLQQWFRRDGGFVYDANAVDAAEDGADLDAFLDEDGGRVGYCEQFAASMAIMARVLGIPARVAVGFLEPTSVGPNQWEYRAWDLHAWPELYFPGSGWVRFEPTPSDRAETAPTWTTANIPDVTQAPSPSATRSSEILPERGAETPQETEETQSEDEAFPWHWVVLGGLVTLVLISALFGPRLLRRRARARRVSAGIEGIWSELQATVTDLGHVWPQGRSPRRQGQAIEGWLAKPVSRSERPDRPRRGPQQAPEAAAALGRLVRELEMSRYSTHASTPRHEAWEADLATIVAAVGAGVTASAERRAHWWPKSLFAGSRQQRRAPGHDKASANQVDELIG